MLVKKSALSVIDQNHDIVEVSYYEHDILSKDSKPFRFAN